MNYFFLFGGAIGDTLLGIQIGRVLAHNKPEAKLMLLTTRPNNFSRELVANIPFVEYRELPKNKVSSWLYLAALMVRPWSSVVYEPFVDPLSLWWRIILWSARIHPQSRGVQTQIHERPVPRKVKRLLYDSRTDNLFSTTAIRVIELWGISPAQNLQPMLELPVCPPSTHGSYILFHFFAGMYRRSLPIEKSVPLLKEARALYPNHKFVLTCATAEEDSARSMAQGIDNTEVIVNPHAQELLCLLTQAQLVVGVASGITHVAAHLKVPSVILCNLSDPCWLPFYNPDATLLYERKNCGCNGDKTGICEVQTSGGLVYRCIYDIPTERVINEMKRRIEPKTLS
jgi:hypothetical protein